MMTVGGEAVPARASAERLFTGNRPSAKVLRDRARAYSEARPGAFQSVDAALRHFRSIRVPASLAWAYKSIDKAASSSALRFLFEIEFGVPLTVSAESNTDINTDVVAHLSYGADVFRTPLELRAGPDCLDGALRLATVRHPGKRAMSAFLYLCRTQDLRSTWMVHDRLRLSALTGFDWRRHPRTLDGFLRFLDYVDAAHRAEAAGGRPVNTHWMRQRWLMRPELFRPVLIGRTEAMAPFYAEVAARLDRPLPADWTGPHTNAQPAEPGADFLAAPAARRRIAEVYGEDFEEFGYDH